MVVMVPVAKISRLFGPQGGLAVNLYDIFPDNIDPGEPLYVCIDMLTVPLFIESFERKGKKGAVIRFSDIDNEHRASELIGLELLTISDGGSAERINDEFYMDDLVGFKVRIAEQNTGKTISGEITAYIDSEMNPLFEVVSNGEEMFFPVAEEFISSIDVDSHIIELTVPEGMIGLN